MKDDLTTRAISGMLKWFAESAHAAQDDPVEEGETAVVMLSWWSRHFCVLIGQTRIDLLHKY